MAGHKPRWYTRPHTVTHASTYRARRRVTSLIETDALPLSQAATPASALMLSSHLGLDMDCVAAKYLARQILVFPATAARLSWERSMQVR